MNFQDNINKILDVLSTGEYLSLSEIAERTGIEWNKMGLLLVDMQGNGLISARTIVLYRLNETIVLYRLNDKPKDKREG